MTATTKQSKVITVCMLNRNSSLFDGYGVPAAFTALGIRYQRSRFGPGWLCPARHTEQVCDYFTARGYRIEAVL